MIKRLKWLGVVVAALVLGGCAHPDFIKVGQSAQEVKVELGAPDGKLVNADGSFVLVYSDQPFGQEVWWMHFDQNGRQNKKPTCGYVTNIFVFHFQMSVLIRYG